MEVEDRKGVLAAVSAKIADINTNIKNMEARTGDDDQRARIDVTVEISDVQHLEKVIKSLKARERRAGCRAGGPGEAQRLMARRRTTRDDVDFDSRVARQPRRLDRRSRRVGFDEERPVDVVHRREIVHVGEKHRRAHHVRVGQSAAFEQRADVLEHPAGLGADVAVDHRAGGRDRTGPVRR